MGFSGISEDACKIVAAGLRGACHHASAGYLPEFSVMISGIPYR
jgi:hypothetical protein